jgi:hypothetical protein
MTTRPVVRASGRGRVDHLVEQDGSGVEVEPEQVVGRAPGPLLGCHHKDLAPSGVDDRGGSDAHRGTDVAADTRHCGRSERRGDVVRPQDATGIRRQRIDGVVLGGGIDPAGGHQRLSVEAAVEGRRRPCRSGRRKRGTRSVHPGAQSVLAVGRPFRRGGAVREDCRRTRARTGTGLGGAAAGGHDEREDGDRQPECGLSHEWGRSVHVLNSTTEPTRRADRAGWRKVRYAR